MSILLSHPRLNGSARHVARALTRAGMLGEFWTCRETLLSAHRRALDAIAADAPCPPCAPPGFHHAICQSLDRDVSARLATERFQGVYACEGAAEETFRTAGEHGLLRCYDLPGGHWQAARAVSEEESAREPAWAATLDPGPCDSRFTDRRAAELAQADLVLVGSTFLLKTLERASAPPAAIATLIPGATPGDRPSTRGSKSPRRKLRALFVGRLQQLKGLSYLFRACRELRADVSLTIMSPPSAVSCPALERELAAVSWRPPVSPGTIRAAMADHDVLLAPSLFEGFDATIPEALASGLPVIATPQTAAPDLIDDRVEGFLVRPRSSEDIVMRLDELRRDPEQLAEMSASAERRARSHSWTAYDLTLAATLLTALTPRAA